MNWLDWLIAVIILISFVGAIVKGLTHELISLAGLVLGLLAALWWYPGVGRRFEPYTSSRGIADFVGFVVILVAFLILGAIVSKLMGKLVKASGLRWFDRLLGAAFGLVRGLLLTAALVLALVTFAPGREPTELVGRSRLAPMVLQCARAIVSVAPRKLKDGFQEGFERVRKFWRESQTDTV
ncbi:MAG: CvpA family protein [Acidobacteria bacterium]|nr:CvpA family protein [Acidobacteriota bacterium]